MKKQFVILAVTMTSILATAAEFRVEKVVNKDRNFHCTTSDFDVVKDQGVGKLVIDENMVSDDVDGRQFSAVRVVFERPQDLNTRARIQMNLFHVPVDGIVQDLEIKYMREIHIRHASLDSYETYGNQSSQTVNSDSIYLDEGSNTSSVVLSKVTGEIESFQTRQVLKVMWLGMIPRAVSDFKINCIAN